MSKDTKIDRGIDSAVKQVKKAGEKTKDLAHTADEKVKKVATTVGEKLEKTGRKIANHAG